ncbi:target of rapamycin complex subunit lst8-like [Mercenaria mercenaria]|uniref:target of rapamycin complex subunit lst8-like n=1 Tax=Mercenaria mercenaria TaxID=6596 RepID=UPI00234EDF31|nr:target of rapamycin complex subunit lst8-like [Mercenaria mercenaria]
MSTGGDNTCDPVILATAGYDHTIRFWQAHSGICYRTVQHPDSVSLVQGKCHIWTLTGGRREEPTQLHPKSDITVSNRYALKCLFSPDSTLLATTLADNSAKIWKTADLTLHTELKENSQRWVWDCAFSGDSQYIITASSDNMARLWSVDTGEVKKEYSGHQKAVVCLAFRDESIQ